MGATREGRRGSLTTRETRTKRSPLPSVGISSSGPDGLLRSAVEWAGLLNTADSRVLPLLASGAARVAWIDVSEA